MGADPAYGSSEWADRFAILLFRCYADRLVQVAEYCSPSITTYQFAWILAHLGGAYRNVHLNLEITGPGGAVQTELMNLQRAAAQIPSGRGSLLDVMGCMRHYMWMRPDMQMSGGVGRSTHWKTTQENKMYLLNAFKDSFEVKRMMLKSSELLLEMRNVVNDKGVIGASGRAKDDRVIAGALAHWVWLQGLKANMMSQKLTYDNVKRRSEQSHGTVSSMQHAVFQYLKRTGIG